MASDNSIYDTIKETYPEIFQLSVLQQDKIFGLRDDVDGKGVWITHWNYEQPIPEGLTLGKPSA
jgi:hypothetical protein